MIDRAWCYLPGMSFPFKGPIYRRLYTATDHTAHHGRPPWGRVYAWIPVTSKEA